jgi:hypothetical protein
MTNQTNQEPEGAGKDLDAIVKLLRDDAAEEREILAEIAAGAPPSLLEARATERFRKVIDRKRAVRSPGRTRLLALAAAIALAASATWLATNNKDPGTGSNDIVLGGHELGLSWVLPTNPATSYDEFRCATTTDAAGVTFELVIEPTNGQAVAPLLMRLGPSPVWKPNATKKATLPRSLRATMTAHAADGRIVDTAVLETSLAP